MLKTEEELYHFFTNEECDEIKRYAYRKEGELINKGHQKRHSGSSIVTEIYYQNFFKDHPTYADRLANFLTQTNKELEWPILVQSWTNIYRKGQGIKLHNHKGIMGKSFAANIFIDGPTKPGTTYLVENGNELEEITIENQKGYIQMFPCAVYHKVNPVESERISIGITLHSFEYITKDIIKLYALNSKAFSTTIILDKPK